MLHSPISPLLKTGKKRENSNLVSKTGVNFYKSENDLKSKSTVRTKDITTKQRGTNEARRGTKGLNCEAGMEMKTGNRLTNERRCGTNVEERIRGNQEKETN